MTEGRVEDAKKRFPGVDVDRLAELDPTPQKKYLGWLAKQASAGVDAAELENLLGRFLAAAQFLPKKNLDSYQTAGEVEAALGEVGPARAATKSSKYQNVAGARLEAQTAEYLVYHVTSHAAMKQLGAGTKWCVASRKPDAWNMYTVFSQKLNTSSSESQFHVLVPLQGGKKYAVQKAWKIRPEGEEEEVTVWDETDQKVRSLPPTVRKALELVPSLDPAVVSGTRDRHVPLARFYPPARPLLVGETDAHTVYFVSRKEDFLALAAERGGSLGEFFGSDTAENWNEQWEGYPYLAKVDEFAYVESARLPFCALAKPGSGEEDAFGVLCWYRNTRSDGPPEVNPALYVAGRKIMPGQIKARPALASVLQEMTGYLFSCPWAVEIRTSTEAGETPLPELRLSLAVRGVQTVPRRGRVRM